MIEETVLKPLDTAPDEIRSSKKPVLFRISFIFSLLGLLTPLLVFLIARAVYKLPCCGEGGTPGDGLGWMLLIIYGIGWWTLTAVLSVVWTVSGLARKERGRMKAAAIVGAGLSLTLLGLIYAAGIFLFMRNL